MLISDLKNNIVTGNISNFYIFTGEEEGIMDIFIHQVAKKKGLTIKWADSLSDISRLVNLKSLIKVDYLYLVRQDNAFKTQETAWEFAKNGIVGQHIILIQPNIDKKTKFYKFFEDKIVKFDKLPMDMLMKYGKQKCKDLSDSNMQSLIEWCGFSYLRLLNELDKIETLKNYCLQKSVTMDANNSMFQLVHENGIFKDQEFDILQYANHVMTRNSPACYKYADQVKASHGELGLIGLLRASFRNLVLLKNDGGGKGVCDRTGMTGWQVKCAVELDEYYNIDECEKNFLFLQDVEVKIKTGVLDPNIVVSYLLSEIL